MKRSWTSAPAALPSIVAAAISLALACGPAAPARPSTERGLIVLGIDGMDPRLLDRYMREGRTPNLTALAERGSYRVLATTHPPQSPVAWSTFLTGLDHDGHGIYDFVHRDPKKLAPYLSTSRTREPESVIRIGSLALPLSSGRIDLLRRGRAFWQILEDAGVPATVVKIPANFPPPDSRMSESMAGMGTPDLLGTYGTFQFYTDDPERAKRGAAGGLVHRLDFASDQSASAWLEGPPDPLSAAGAAMRLPVTVIRSRRQPVALIRLGATEVILQPGEWSDWIPIDFETGIVSSLVADDIAGMVRLYLAATRPRFQLYVSPINIDPMAPAVQLSSPSDYAEKLAHDIGRFYTQGMPQDTKALASGILSDDEFLSQTEIIYTERLALLERELDRYRGGVLFFYVSSIDEISHVFWRSIEPDASAEDARYAHVIPDMYQRVDALVGRVIERARPGDDVIVMSDHGFAPYRYKVHLNTWLAQEGYLGVLPAGRVASGPLGHIDWDTTQAYALGLNQLFINLRGREARGTVPPSEYEILLRRLTHDLESLRDPETGARMITAVTRPKSGPNNDRAPDLVIGYNRGYRSSDQSALGQVGTIIVERNRDKWSGDHCMHPSHVPGVLLATRAIEFGSDARRAARGPSLHDLVPTILAHFDIEPPAQMPGRPLWRLRRGGLQTRPNGDNR